MKKELQTLLNLYIAKRNKLQDKLANAKVTDIPINTTVWRQNLLIVTQQISALETELNAQSKG